MALKNLFLSIIFFAVIISVAFSAATGNKRAYSKASVESWDYENVKPNGYMFWWLYKTTAAGNYVDQPLILWLQGGPGASSTGYGNFAEVGPLDIYLQPRNWSWVEHVNVLFVDNPVGTGYSYVTAQSAYSTTNEEIGNDLVTLFKGFLAKNPEFETVPFYIFSESYGGKMAIAFADALNTEVVQGTVTTNFKGVAMGDGWVSPIDSVLTWGPYLYQTSMVDEKGQQDIDAAAAACKAEVDAGNWVAATNEWGNTESVVSLVTYGVNFYNILLRPEETVKSPRKLSTPGLTKMYERHVLAFQRDQIDDIMNNEIREKLGIIPESVTWGGQSGDVFNFLAGDFMKPATETVEKVLNTTSLSTIVYNAQLDLIVDSPGTTAWVKNLHWPGGSAFLNTARRLPISIVGDPVEGYVKVQDNFAFYWILNAGHMIPQDNPETGVKMLNMITKNDNRPF